MSSLRASLAMSIFLALAGCPSEQPGGEIMLVLDGTVALPGDIDGVHIDIRTPDRLVHSGDYGFTGSALTLPSTLGVVPGSTGQRRVYVRVIGRLGGAAGRVRMLREVRTQIPENRIAALPINLTSNCLGFVRESESDPATSCDPDLTCVDGACAPIDLDPSSLPDFVPGASYKDAAPAPSPPAPAPDAAAPEGGGGDAGVDATVDAGGAIHDMTNPSYWAAFDLASVDNRAQRFKGAAFDGRYVYFVPTEDGLAARYDSQFAGGSPFTTRGAWSTFDFTTLDARAKGYNGTTFDGRYVYFAPDKSRSTENGLVVRYDTQGSAFTAAGAWSTFDLTTVNANAAGYNGSAFDGRYVYFVPDGQGRSGRAARYDTQSAAGFGAAGAWSIFDMVTVDPGLKGFKGAVFDRRYVYFVPNDNGASSGLVGRYDTQGAFGAAGSWSAFDLSVVNSRAKGYVGGAFDGRYVYFVPTERGGSPHGVAGRYDTQGAFGVSGSWSTFDLATLNPGAIGFNTAGFDGRYVYFVPNDNGSFNEIFARFDTQSGGAFTTPGAWSTFDLAAVNGRATQLKGTTFDGRYLYFAPEGGGIVVRFDARTPPLLPPGFSGSFF